MTPQNLSVTAPVGQALERTRKVLFQPFDAARWFIIGFCAWLAALGQSGFHGGFNSFGRGSHHGGAAQNIEQGLREARDYVMSNLAWFVPVMAAILVLGVIVWLVVLWVSSRGRFMFLHCLAHNVAQVQVPWHRYAAEARSLFWFRLVFSVIGLAAMLPLVGGLVLLGVQMTQQNAPPAVWQILTAAALVLVMLVAGLVFWVIVRLLRDFVIPLQFLRRSGCVDAWREFRGLMAGNTVSFVIYLLFRIVLAIAIALLVIIVVVATCCIAGCLFALPYLGTVFLLPVRVFDLGYALHYLAQFGPDYDVFSAPAAATAPSVG